VTELTADLLLKSLGESVAIGCWEVTYFQDFQEVIRGTDGPQINYYILEGSMSAIDYS